MMATQTSSDSGNAVRGRARTRLATGLVAVTASAAAAVSLATSASAAVPGDFSPYIPPSIRYVDDCRVEIGPVLDVVPLPNYAKIGGVRINCSSPHSVIDATVAEYYSNGSRWVQYGSSAYGVRYNAYGSGAGLDGILRSPRVCFGTNNRGWSWSTVALVRTERTARVVQSDPMPDPYGC